MTERIRLSAGVTPSVPRLLVLEGNGVARGVAYGEAARDLIVESGGRLLDTLGRELRTPVATYLDLLVERTGFRTAARRLATDILDEVDGIATGSGVDAQTVLALNLLDEEWWFRSRYVTTPTPGDRCSSFGVAPTSSADPIIGQNMDLPDLQGLQVMLDIRPDQGPRILAPSYAGMIATNAMNEYGVGICLNTLPQLASSAAGLPVAFVLRLLASAPTLEAALSHIKSVPHASGQNYIVGTPSAIACFECGANGVSKYDPGVRIAHTNHPLVDLSKEPGSSARGADHAARVRTVTTMPSEVSANSVDRLTFLQKQIMLPTFGVAAAKKVLSSRPVLRGGATDPQGSTFYGVIMLPARKKLLLTNGAPCASAFHEYGFC
jgi:isopenicillin-N N-acyltransferase-like protein